jgi:hypothetical protein
MKYTITLLFIALISFSNLTAQSVNIEGNPYSGNPYATITDAIAASTNPSDVVLITGTHTEFIAISKSITIRGVNPLTDIIQAAANPAVGGTGTRVINIAGVAAVAINVTIENLSIRHGNFNANGGAINIDKITGLVTLKI